jgi:hypothetical protein
MPTLTFLEAARHEFAYYRKLGERSLAVLSDEELFRLPGPGSNSIALLVKHMHGNMMSRWTDFLTTDGEKPWRQRDAEFEEGGLDRAALMERWKDGWNCLETALEGLTSADLTRIVLIRNEPHTVAQAITRQLAHLPYHVGQIVLLAKLYKGMDFPELSVPRGGSGALNRQKGMR